MRDTLLLRLSFQPQDVTHANLEPFQYFASIYDAAITASANTERKSIIYWLI